MTINISQNEANKHFETDIKNSEHSISYIANNIYSDEIKAKDRSLYYNASYSFNVIPIPKPGEKIAETWSHHQSKAIDTQPRCKYDFTTGVYT